jgi:uncharacterized protein YfaT (DUF1175 family)
MMSDRRQSFRNRVCYGGLIAFNAKQSTVECVVRNFNALGAKIELDSSAIVPDWIDFAVPRKKFSCLARFAWRERDAAGLVFSASRETSNVIPMEWARKLRASEQANEALQLRIGALRPKE